MKSLGRASCFSNRNSFWHSLFVIAKKKKLIFVSRQGPDISSFCKSHFQEIQCQYFRIFQMKNVKTKGLWEPLINHCLGSVSILGILFSKNSKFIEQDFLQIDRLPHSNKRTCSYIYPRFFVRIYFRVPRKWKQRSGSLWGMYLISAIWRL